MIGTQCCLAHLQHAAREAFSFRDFALSKPGAGKSIQHGHHRRMVVAKRGMQDCKRAFELGDRVTIAAPVAVERAQ